MDQQLEQLRRALASAVQGMSSEELTRHLAGKWSAAEVLEHLCRTYSSTVKVFERCVQANKPLATSPTLKQRIAAAVTLGAGAMPGKRQAPPYTVPQGMPPEKVLPELEKQMAAMDAIIAQCEDRFGKRVKLADHRFLGPLTGAQWRKFHCVHGRHHRKQILRMRASE